MTPEELAEAKDIAHGLFAITDSIVEHYEAKAIKMYSKLLEHIDSQAEEIAQLNMECARTDSGWNSDIDHYENDREKTHAALKKLGEKVRARGKALVEERADAIQQNPNRTWEMTRDQATARAREQLRVEGVIR